MSVKSIGRDDFVRLLSLHSDLESFIGDEVEWFSNKAGNVVGTIALGDQNRGWNYIILRRNQTGKFRACNVVCDLYTKQAAKVDCMFAMAAAEKDGQEICSSAD